MSGHAAAPPINEMNSRRFIAPPRTQDQGIVPCQTSKLKEGSTMSALGHKRHMQRKTSCPLYPRKRTCAVQLGMSALGQKRTHALQQFLFDHLVGAGDQRWRHGDAERSGGHEIDDQHKLCRLLDMQIVRFRTLENPTRVVAAQAIVFSNSASVAHQTAGHDKFAKLENRRNRMTRRQSDK